MISLSNITQKQWIKACRKLGLDVNTSAGKGSHVIVKNGDTDSRAMTIQNHIYPLASKRIYKKLQEWGFSENEIDKALK